MGVRICGQCKRPHPQHWATPFTLPPLFPGLRAEHKRGRICSWCWRDYKGRRRPMADEWKAGRFLHSLVVMPVLIGRKDP